MTTAFSGSRFSKALKPHASGLNRGALEVLQVNVGRKCNQACRHCHVDAAPWRTEMMSAEVATKICDWITKHRPKVVDITGGAPEISEFFPKLVQTARNAGARVIDRNNLTILSEPGFDWLASFLAGHQVEIVASLPCYSAGNVNRQRGNGVFEKSITGLQQLNALGYGKELVLNLVYNPVGPSLPPDQEELEKDYKKALHREFGIVFNHLHTITNQPIARFAEDLQKQGRLEEYMELLTTHFNPSTLPGLMCKSTLSVDYEGALYDCDFNQMLGLRWGGDQPVRLWDVTPGETSSRPIQTRDHCLACTAGAGSSCGGALTAA